MIESGMSIARWAAEMTATASDKAAPGATLKLIVAAGNCSWWLMVSGAVVRTISANELSGTCAVAATLVTVTEVAVVSWAVLWVDEPPGTAGAESRVSRVGSVWYSGIASRITRYWLDWP